MGSMDYRDYDFQNSEASHMHRHFMTHVHSESIELKPGSRVLDVGCRNGFTCGEFSQARLRSPREQLNARDRIRCRVVLAPAFVLFYTLLGNGLILDGWPGWYYAFQRTLAEMLLSLRLMESKLNTKSRPDLRLPTSDL
jgi:hypothetical protein